MERVPAITPLEARDLANEGAVLIDVREPDEWSAGRAPDAVHIPLGDLEGRRSDVPTDRRVVFVCRSGARSGKATEFFRSQGVDAVNLAGGMQAWAAAELPMEADDGPPAVV